MAATRKTQAAKKQTKPKARKSTAKPKPQPQPEPEEQAVNDENTTEQEQPTPDPVPLPQEQEEQEEPEEQDVYVAVLDMLLPPETDGGYTGVVEPEAFERNTSGALVIPHAKPLNPHWFTPEMWEQWVESRKVVPLKVLAVIGNEEALKRVIKLVHDSEGELQMESLKWQGGFNRTVNRNTGVHFGGTIGG